MALDYLFLDGSHFKFHQGSAAEPVLVAWGITTDGKPVSPHPKAVRFPDSAPKPTDPMVDSMSYEAFLFAGVAMSGGGDHGPVRSVCRMPAAVTTS